LIARFPAEELERLVKSQVLGLLQSPSKLMGNLEEGPFKDVATASANDLAKKWPKWDPSEQREVFGKTLNRVVLGQTTVTIEIDTAKLFAVLLAENPEALTSLHRHKFEDIKITGEFQFLRRDSGLGVIAATNGSCLEGAPTLSLAKAVARARDWYGRIVAGEINSIDQLAQRAGLTRRYVRTLMLFARLSPRLTEGILMGKHRADLTVRTILQGVPLSWQEQERRFG
jgi:hypothetical protein